MITLSSIVTFLIGYALRHLDLFRWHVPIDPIREAVREHAKQQAEQMKQDILSKLGAGKQQSSGPPAA